MITSPDNARLKLIRRLHERRGREREGLFVSEGEDLFEAGLASGAEPRLVLSAAGSGIGGLEVEPALLDRHATLASGTRVIAVWEQRWATRVAGEVCVYLHAVGDPANVGALARTTEALVEGTLVLGPACADPFGPRAVRASMGSVFGQPLLRGSLDDTPEPRIALLAHGGGQLDEVLAAIGAGRVTVCLGAEREGLPQQVVEGCRRSLTIPLRPGVESLNVATAAAIVLQRISSPASEPASLASAGGERDG